MNKRVWLGIIVMQHPLRLCGLPTVLVSEISSFGGFCDYVALGSTCVFMRSVAQLHASSPHSICLPRDIFPPADAAFWRYVRPRHLTCTIQHALSVDVQLDSIGTLKNSLRSLYIERSERRLRTTIDLSFMGAFACLQSLCVPDPWCDIHSMSSSLTELDFGQCSAASARLVAESIGVRLRLLRLGVCYLSHSEKVTVWRAIAAHCTSITDLHVDFESAVDICTIVTALPRIRSLGAYLALDRALKFECLTLEECVVHGPPKDIRRLLRGAPNLRHLEWYTCGDDTLRHLESDSTADNSPIRHTSLVSLVFKGFRYNANTSHSKWARTLLTSAQDDGLTVRGIPPIEVPSLSL
jgi:hypothetical protein